MKEEQKNSIDMDAILANEDLIRKLSAKVLDVIHGTGNNDCLNTPCPDGGDRPLSAIVPCPDGGDRPPSTASSSIQM
ncbi:MAG: hypothetical protein D3909_06405 [Candidatus Electrothrix sp. ATG1]|nr:hypothetical protein [Candidatus Electrothrix sp. ATG1]MCI5208724.1 hypothetical protein [Candidatus Electrothrix sp. ATG2]